MTRDQERFNDMYEMVQENNELLHTMEKRAKVGIAFKVLYFAFLFGILGGAYYFVQPYINMAVEKKHEIESFIEKVNSLKVPTNGSQSFSLPQAGAKAVSATAPIEQLMGPLGILTLLQSLINK